MKKEDKTNVMRVFDAAGVEYSDFSFDAKEKSGAEAAAEICEGLRELFDARTESALGSILANIDSFFSELDFRARQLKRLGMEGDLSGQLLAFLSHQQPMPAALSGYGGPSLPRRGAHADLPDRGLGGGAAVRRSGGPKRHPGGLRFP